MISPVRDVVLSSYTTFGVGGRARYFFRLSSVEDCIDALNFCEENHLPFFILGGGSNVLISDDGFNGCVIKNEIGADTFCIDVQPIDNHYVRVRCCAGKEWDALVDFCVQKKIAELEALSGIPGTVGAAPVQNIGAYGVSVGDYIECVEALDTISKKVISLSREQCEFSYRSSIFKTHKNRFIIYAVIFRLANRSRVAVPKYHDIHARLPFAPFGVPLQKLRRIILDIRAQKGMAQKDGIESQKTAGSFFKNPMVSEEEFEHISQKIDIQEQKAHWPWFWELSGGRVKIAAAFLMEQAGFTKGYQVGGVGLSPYHALALVNYGGATAGQIASFAKDIQKKVFQKYRVILEPEVQCIGFDEYPFFKK